MSTSRRADLRSRPGRAAALALLLVLALGAPTPAVAAPTAATGACRSVQGGGLQTGGGPSRATVVVDTGSGPVWSACISFSGSISGIGALDLAARVIPGLDPAYDIYAGQGRAVCKLLGVGNDPPDCLGKSVEYWGYFHDGRYSSLGAGAVTVRDGDVDGWRWGTSGSAPRRPTAGTEAAPAPPPTTAPPTTRSAPPATTSAGAMSGSPSATTTPVAPGGGPSPTWPSTTAVGAASSSTTAPARAGGATVTSTTVRGASSHPAAARSSGSPGAEQATGRSAGPTPPSQPTTSGGSGWGSAATFGLILAAILGIGLFLRSRRAPAAV